MLEVPKAPDNQRLSYVFWLSLAGVITAGLVGLGVVAIVVFSGNKTAEIVSAAMAPLTTLIGTVAGVVAGQQVGSAGKEASERRADQLQAQSAALSQADPHNYGALYAQAVKDNPTLFGVRPSPSQGGGGPTPTPSQAGGSPTPQPTPAAP